VIFRPLRLRSILGRVCGLNLVPNSHAASHLSYDPIGEGAEERSQGKPSPQRVTRPRHGACSPATTTGIQRIADQSSTRAHAAEWVIELRVAPPVPRPTLRACKTHQRPEHGKSKACSAHPACGGTRPVWIPPPTAATPKEALADRGGVLRAAAAVGSESRSPVWHTVRANVWVVDRARRLAAGWERSDSGRAGALTTVRYINGVLRVG